MAAACIFCKIIAGDIPSHKIMENDHVFAFMDINPVAEGHCLVIPKYHCEKVHELPEEYGAEVGRMLVKVSKAVGAENYNLLQNNGELAHQAVKHVHFHIIPKPNASEGLGVGWPTKPTDHEAFAKKATEIAGKL
eukprot:NODE_2984_length_613_cov_57.076241_g2491_i0.p1 GENE.NODE_2984_length_613_cov_57.076241_g2491_i0~~NODE_2984_length_613_cov_57.076241_g2491_i0.p1  ORF type:complete len:135 (-),score=32.45 NODE_2984_length_613_cov_57.076241_g2491_i0:153-557(-)